MTYSVLTFVNHLASVNSRVAHVVPCPGSDVKKDSGKSAENSSFFHLGQPIVLVTACSPLIGWSSLFSPLSLGAAAMSLWAVLLLGGFLKGDGCRSMWSNVDKAVMKIKGQWSLSSLFPDF